MERHTHTNASTLQQTNQQRHIHANKQNLTHTGTEPHAETNQHTRFTQNQIITKTNAPMATNIFHTYARDTNTHTHQTHKNIQTNTQ
jgi:hypothetical protein